MMKYIASIILILTVSTMAELVYVSKSKSYVMGKGRQGRVVCLTRHQSLARQNGIIVQVTKNKAMAKTKGYWFITKNKSEAKLFVFITKNKSEGTPLYVRSGKLIVP